MGVIHPVWEGRLGILDKLPGLVQGQGFEYQAPRTGSMAVAESEVMWQATSAVKTPRGLLGRKPCGSFIHFTDMSAYWVSAAGKGDIAMKRPRLPSWSSHSRQPKSCLQLTLQSLSGRPSASIFHTSAYPKEGDKYKELQKSRVI